MKWPLCIWVGLALTCWGGGAAGEVQVPDWAKHAVWYQIFPERFRNGDPANDPQLADLEGAWPHFLDTPWQVHPWTSDWYAVQSWEQTNGRGLWPNIQRRRYGGDLQGILDQLDYLQDLGINAIYLNPVFAAPSLHKYDAMTYHHVDPTFGPDRAGDLKRMAEEQPGDYTNWVWTAADQLLVKLVAECHARGMRVILDGVFNHLGLRSWPFEDVKKNQRASPYADWFTIRSWDQPAAGSTFDYEGWLGVRELPELREDENGLVAGPRDYIYAITRRWMDPNGDGDPADGIDGWRLDVAFCVGHPFWKAWRQHVKAINPQAYLVAEVVEPPENLKRYLAGDEFDAVMNYNFAFACDEFLLARRPISAQRFDRLLRELREAFDPAIAYAQFNLFGSHDTARLATHARNAGRLNYRDWSSYHGQAKPESGILDPRAPDAIAVQRQQLVAFLQMTYVGAPVIYYGDEVGMWGPNEPCCRKPMLWPDLAFADEAWNPDGTPRVPPDPVRPEADLRAYYRKLIHLRREHAALREGTFRTAFCADQRGYGFWRETAGESLLVALNASDELIEVRIEAAGTYRDLLDPDYRVTAHEGALPLALPPVRGRILMAEQP